MNETNQGSNSDFPVKRKRGRPRKDQSQNRSENVRIPAGFEGMDVNQTLQVEPINVVNDTMVGQVVTGVVDASFDAGYLLTVRVGNSDTTLRGVVFKPGRFVPISSENDVAPQVQMILRTEIPFPAENQNQGQGDDPRSRERNEQNLQGNETAHPWGESLPANPVPAVVPQAAEASKGKQVQTVTTQTASHPVDERDSLAAVALEPVGQSNGAPLLNQVSLAASPIAPEEKEVLEDALQYPNPSNGSISNNQVPAELLQDAEFKSMQMPKMPFETLLGKVIRRIQVPSRSDAQIKDIEPAGQMLVNDSGLNSEGDGSNLNQTLIIKHFQTTEPNSGDQSATAPMHLETTMTDKMMDLLQVLPENARESQMPGIQVAADSSGHNFDEPRNPDEGIGDESAHSNTIFLGPC